MRRTRQRLGAGAAGGGAELGSGNGEPASGAAAGAAAAAGFGFFGPWCFLDGFGGVAGCSSANTGFGSVVTVPGVKKSLGFLMTFTGTEVHEISKT